jgi:hypothetical protein
MDDERRREAERQAAAKRALSPQVRADALRLVTEWNERQAQRAPLIRFPSDGCRRWRYCDGDNHVMEGSCPQTAETE